MKFRGVVNFGRAVQFGRALCFVAVGSLILLALAAPAGADPLVAAAKPWHYWAAPILAFSFLGLLGMLGLGYAVRVLMPKYGVRIGRR